MAHAKTSYVCLSCRTSYKQPYDRTRQRTCPRCAQPLIHAGSAFAAPRRRDAAAWRTLTVLLNAACGVPQELLRRAWISPPDPA